MSKCALKCGFVFSVLAYVVFRIQLNCRVFINTCALRSVESGESGVFSLVWSSCDRALSRKM